MSRPLSTLALLALLTGCSAGPREGVAVGNPGQGMTVQTEPSAEVLRVNGSVDVSELRIVTCDGDAYAILRGVTISAVGRTELPLPADPLCSVEIDFAGPLRLDGELHDGRTFDLELQLDNLIVENDTPFMNRVPLLLVLGPGPWLTAEALGFDEASEAEIDPGDPLHDDLAGLVQTRSFLCEDRDDDGMREPGDRILAWGPDADDTDIPAEPGWQTAP
jgi:hypothetical protein